MHKSPKKIPCGTDDDRIQLLLQKTEEEYIRLGKNIIRLVLDASHRIDGYADEIIELKQKREGKDK